MTVTVPEGFNKLLVVEGLTCNGTPIQTVEEQQRAAELEASRRGRNAPWAVPPFGSRAPSARASWAARRSQKEAEPLSARLLPRAIRHQSRRSRRL